MKKKFLFLTILVFSFAMILPINADAKTNNKKTSSKKTTVESMTKKYFSKEGESTQTPSSNGFGSAYINGFDNNSGLLTGFTSNDERFVDITLHAGDKGYFGTPDKKTKISTQFKGDPFTDRTVPDVTDSSYIFLGWARTEDATPDEVLIPADGSYQVAVTRLDTEDLYAVYTNECTIIYNARFGIGYFEESVLDEPGVTEEDRYEGKLLSIKKQYTCNTNFTNFIPSKFASEETRYNFDGWYDNTNPETGNKYTEETKVEKQKLNVIASWIYNTDSFDTLVPGHEYNHTLSNLSEYYKFTPSETKVYEVFMKDIENTGGQTDILLDVRDLYGRMLKTSNIIVDGKVSFLYQFEKGITYTIVAGQQNENIGFLEFKFGIREGNHKTVTYHANSDYAWFDNAHTQKTLDVPYVKGTKILTAENMGLITDRAYRFVGWKTTPDGEYDPDLEITIEDDMNLYADVVEVDSIKLYANGGYFSNLNKQLTVTDYVYQKGSTFNPWVMLRHDDNTKAFAGWSRNPNATKPDEDILEEVTIADDIEGPLYAVYTDKILITFNANGGYFLDNPSVTTYQSSKGVGHIFWGLALFHEDKDDWKALGWYDQDKEYIPYTPGAYPYYHTKGDTTLTAIWGKRIVLDANGGEFTDWGARALQSYFVSDEPFSLDDYWDTLGKLEHENKNLYLAGWATTPDATEPDIVEGETIAGDLGRIYAVWKEDTYIFKKGDKSTWEQESKNGLEFVIKRQGDDSNTYSLFEGLYVDSNLVDEKYYTKEKGSLKLTLTPEYLNSLSLGEHEIAFNFEGNKVANSTLKIVEKSTIPDDDKTNPKTGDNILRYIIILGVSFVGLLIAIVLVFKKKKIKTQ